ncbi:hypothetical protein [Celeribacter sp. SCSIO 80788]|uniref:hypothetical protein n=1 Tax=Celeribacter sp. SCSIO 80788 TaxID=3117013 RepID=UPI003DA52ECB
MKSLLTAATLSTTLFAIPLTGVSAEGLADMKPMTLRVASLYGPDNWFTAPMEAYTSRLEERSGGKLTFEYYYAGSLVPAKELTSALGDGIFDFGFVLPAYEPAKFSVDEWQGSLAIPSEQNPILEVATTALAGYEWNTGLSSHTKQLLDAGIFPVMPSFSITGPYGILCKDENATMADLEGKRSRVAGETWTKEAQNLGLTPVALPITEVYQSFQSGVIDCWMGGLADAGANGFFDHGKYFNLGVGLTAYAQSVYGFNLDTWNAFPEELKAIVWDETAQYASELLEAALKQQLNAATSSLENGVVYTTPDAEMRAKVDTYHDEVRENAAANSPAEVEDPAAEVARLAEIRDKWHGILGDELGFGGDYTSWGDFVAKGGELPDFAPLKAHILSEIVTPFATAQE